jgi:hypothetical protein
MYVMNVFTRSGCDSSRFAFISAVSTKLQGRVVRKVRVATREEG